MTVKKTSVILVLCAILLSGCSTSNRAGAKDIGSGSEVKSGDREQVGSESGTVESVQTNQDTRTAVESRTAADTAEEAYHKIDAEEAKRMMDEEEVVIVDVRRVEEYEASHIPGAILIPNEEIGEEEPEKLPDKDAVLLIYCRTGVRSKQASDKLVELGYKNVYDMGGIVDWPYETVSERTGRG